MTELEIIEACKQEDKNAQRLLYDRYSSKLFGVCKRYIKQREDAEDILVEGLFKILTKIHLYSGEGNFQAWMRKIIVNECLMFLRKKHNFNLSLENSNIEVANEVTVEDKLAENDIIRLLDKLPTGYRTVFNLYVMEGYKHREIADLLGISINTSKSQLILAKKRLESMIHFNSQMPEIG